MTRRSLPERTVDAWVSSAVCAAFPRARIWGPTQNIEQTNWDYGLSLGDGKLFILEDKGTTAIRRKRKKPLDTHSIYIDTDQLAWYCNQVERAADVPVYYVLPKPPWLRAVTGSEVVPDQAVCRVESVAGAFPDWAFVCRAGDLRAQLASRSTLYTDQLPFKGSWTLSEFFGQVKDCSIGKRIAGKGEASALAAKAPEQVGQQPTTAALSIGSHNRLSYVGSALAVFVPAEDLPGWSR